MFGSIGISANVVFRTAFILFSLSSFVYADIFTKKSKEALDEQKIIVFISPQCNSCQKSLKDLSAFKKRNPYWKIEVYVMASMQEFLDFFRTQGIRMPSSLEYTLDFKDQLANRYEIGITPSYIIINQGQTTKVEGYVDLQHFNLDG